MKFPDLSLVIIFQESSKPAETAESKPQAEAEATSKEDEDEGNDELFFSVTFQICIMRYMNYTYIHIHVSVSLPLFSTIIVTYYIKLTSDY